MIKREIGGSYPQDPTPSRVIISASKQEITAYWTDAAGEEDHMISYGLNGAPLGGFNFKNCQVWKRMLETDPTYGLSRDILRDFQKGIFKAAVRDGGKVNVVEIDHKGSVAIRSAPSGFDNASSLDPYELILHQDVSSSQDQFLYEFQKEFGFTLREISEYEYTPEEILEVTDNTKEIFKS